MTTYSAEGLGWKYYRPDKLLDGRGRDVSEAATIPIDQPITRVMPTAARWSALSRLSAIASPFPFSVCAVSGALAANATVANP